MKSRVVGIFAIVLCVMLLASAQEVKVNNTSVYVGKSRWKWTLFVEAPPDVLDKIKCVEYTLHPTFPNPIQVVCDRGNDKEAFALPGDGWGRFAVRVKVSFTDGRPPQSYSYFVKLSERTPE